MRHAVAAGKCAHIAREISVHNGYPVAPKGAKDQALFYPGFSSYRDGIASAFGLEVAPRHERLVVREPELIDVSGNQEVYLMDNRGGFIVNVVHLGQVPAPGIPRSMRPDPTGRV
jgi:hypothetical protein